MTSTGAGMVAGRVAWWLKNMNIVSPGTEWCYERIVHASRAERARDNDYCGFSWDRHLGQDEAQSIGIYVPRKRCIVNPTVVSGQNGHLIVRNQSESVRIRTASWMNIDEC